MSGENKYKELKKGFYNLLDDCRYNNRTQGNFSPQLEKDIENLMQVVLEWKKMPSLEGLEPSKSVHKVKNSFNQQVLNLLYQKVVYKAIDRPVLQGFLFEKGSVIATDAHILAIISMDYPKENEGKIIDKQGKIIDGNFPNYKKIMPDLSADYRKIDNPNLTPNYTQWKYASDDKYMLYNFRIDKKRIDTVKKIFAKFKETSTLYLHKTDTQQPMVFKSKTVYMLVMPMYNG